MNTIDISNKKIDIKTVLRFLQRTKDREYTEIVSIPKDQIRVVETREINNEEELYSYSYNDL